MDCQLDAFCVPWTMNWVAFPELKISVLDTEVTEEQYLLLIGGSLPWHASWIIQPCLDEPYPNPAPPLPPCAELGADFCQNTPVHGLTLVQAQDVCARVAGRLFTMAEWQQLAGSPPSIYDGSTWHTQTDKVVVHTCDSGQELVKYYPRDVKGKTANSDGLYGLWGNVAEWTQDNYCPGVPWNQYTLTPGNCPFTNAGWFTGVRCVRDL